MPRDKSKVALAIKALICISLGNRGPTLEWKTSHLVFGFSAAAIASYAFFSCPRINNESAIMLTIFNFLFVSVTFPLNGTLVRKSALLLIGNVIGLSWNYLFSALAHVVAYYFGESANTLYMILSPFANLIWIVSYWSVCLTVLSKSENRKTED